jgi:hypothetical protein
MKQTPLLLMAVIATLCCIAQAQAQPATAPQQQSTAPQQQADSLSRTTPPATDSLPHQHRKHSYLEAALSFQNNDVYLGRKPATTLPYYIPALSYYHKSGVFLSSSLDYLKNSQTSRIDLFTIDAGYMFTVHKYEGTLTLTKYFYNNQSTNLASEIRSAIAYGNAYDLGFIKPRLTLTLNFSEKTDVEGLFDLEHTFSLLGDKLDITPTMTMEGSSLNYYDSYRRRKYKTKKKSGTAAVTSSVENAPAFRLMDYEPSLPVEYTIGKCTLSFTPAYAIPVNPATIDVHTVRDDGTVLDKTRQEQIGNSFYFTLGASFLF